MERAGLPAGVRRLLDLAEAVPEKKGARKEAAKATFLERVGHAAIGAGLAFQHDRPAVRHDQAIPSEERTRLSECDLRIVLADQARPLRDQQDFSGRPVIDRPDQMVAEWREPMINITSHGVHFALLQGQLLAGGDQSLGIS